MELYDLESDIGETKDLAAKNLEIITRMKAIMRKEHAPHPNWIFQGEPGYKLTKQSKSKKERK